MRTRTHSEGHTLAIEADRCVKCALCLPHCPTYKLSHNESDSPRGRISLIQALLENSVEGNDQSIRDHLDKCLDCRACEAVCPAGVKYGQIIDGARNHLLSSSRTRLSFAIQFAVKHPKLFEMASSLVRNFFKPAYIKKRHPEYYQYLRQWARAPKLSSQQPLEPGPEVALFSGCIGKNFDSRAITAIHQLLTSSGYRVKVPRGQSCCGALAYHSGNTKSAKHLAIRNVKAFGSYKTIVGCASGCSAHLTEYGTFCKTGAELSSKVKEAPDLIAKALETGALTTKIDSPLQVALHVPCTARNVLRSEGSRRCLEALPGIEIVELPMGCCGAAGSYFLDFPKYARKLRLQHISAIKEAHADCVVTSNVGCRLHLQAGLSVAGANIEVLHVAELVLSRVHTQAE